MIFLVLKQKWFFGILFFENYLMLNEEKRAYMLRNLIFQTKVNSYFLATAKVDKIKKKYWMWVTSWSIIINKIGKHYLKNKKSVHNKYYM